jgi:formate dehydrogenase iron-sulfur subunit
MAKLMLIDTSKCIGCKACQIACQQWHQLPAEDTSFTGSYQNPEDLSSASLTVVKFFEVGNNGDLRWLFFVDRCRHCEVPLCAEECPRDAITVKPNGIVVITKRCNPDKCSPYDVKPCQLACPFKTGPGFEGKPGTPRYKLNDGSRLANGDANKCDFCYDRWGSAALKSLNGVFAKSNRPACALACPTGAISTMTGKRAKLNSMAEERAEYLRANGYPNARIYPKGYATHVKWVLLEEAAAYGLHTIE